MRILFWRKASKRPTPTHPGIEIRVSVPYLPEGKRDLIRGDSDWFNVVGRFTYRDADGWAELLPPMVDADGRRVLAIEYRSVELPDRSTWTD